MCKSIKVPGKHLPAYFHTASVEPTKQNDNIDNTTSQLGG